MCKKADTIQQLNPNKAMGGQLSSPAGEIQAIMVSRPSCPEEWFPRAWNSIELMVRKVDFCDLLLCDPWWHFFLAECDLRWMPTALVFFVTVTLFTKIRIMEIIIYP